MICQNITKLKEEIVQQQTSLRSSRNITIIAVSKTQPIQNIICAFNAGITDFGENYLQEALSKITVLNSYPITWHYIGAIQKNKIKKIAENFSWVHTISDIHTAEKLNKNRPLHLPPLQVCIQINIHQEPTKSGIFIEQLAELITRILPLNHLKLRGFMVIPAIDQSKTAFIKTAELLEQYNQSFNLSMDTLSMGMSQDYRLAVKLGSTCVRIGTSIFGARK